MPNFKQAERFLTVTTPLGSDALLAVGLEETVESSIKMVAGTSNTQRASSGYGGNAELGAAGGGLGGGLGGLAKGTTEIDAGKSITLKVGNSSITITPESISITATSITIGTGAVNIAGNLSVEGAAVVDGAPFPPPV